MIQRFRAWSVYATGVVVLIVLGVGIPALLLERLGRLMAAPIVTGTI